MKSSFENCNELEKQLLDEALKAGGEAVSRAVRETGIGTKVARVVDFMKCVAHVTLHSDFALWHTDVPRIKTDLTIADFQALADSGWVEVRHVEHTVELGKNFSGTLLTQDGYELSLGVEPDKKTGSL